MIRFFNGRYKRKLRITERHSHRLRRKMVRSVFFTQRKTYVRWKNGRVFTPTPRASAKLTHPLKNFTSVEFTRVELSSTFPPFFPQFTLSLALPLYYIT